MKVKMIVGLCLLVITLVFGIQNGDVVGVTFLFWTFSVSKALLIFVVFGIGTLLGWVLHSVF